MVSDIVYCHPDIWGKWSNLTSTCFSDGLVQPATRKRLVQRSHKLVWKNLYIYIYEAGAHPDCWEKRVNHWNSWGLSVDDFWDPSLEEAVDVDGEYHPLPSSKENGFGVFSIWGQPKNRHHKSTLESKNTKVKLPKSMGRGWGVGMVINEWTQQHSQLHIIYIYVQNKGLPITVRWG